MNTRCPPRLRTRDATGAGFTLTDLLVILVITSLVGSLAIVIGVRSVGKAKLARCEANLKQVNQALLQFAKEQRGKLPRMEGSPPPGGWWHYKELVKGYLGLSGPPSANDRVFACPSDRGYGDGPGECQPFRSSTRHGYNSYVFNGVNLPGMPNIGGRAVSTIARPERTLLVMEWTAHAPLSWHRSLTGRANTPFYCDAQSVVGFVDGHVAFTKIFYDGLNAAYTRDPAPGYSYQYSGD